MERDAIVAAFNAIQLVISGLRMFPQSSQTLLRLIQFVLSHIMFQIKISVLAFKACMPTTNDPVIIPYS